MKKKKKKKDREKKHKHHKEKKHKHQEEESSQDETMYHEGEENSLSLPENMQYYANMTTSNNPCGQPQTKPIIPLKVDSPTKSIHEHSGNISIPSPCTTPGYSTPGSALTPKLIENPKTPSTSSESGREPRTCVLKLKQSKTPLIKLLDHLIRALEKRDPHAFFAWPVTDDIAPNYTTIITKPMDFSTIRLKIEDNEYASLMEFTADFKLMCDNAIKYNHSDTVYHKAAKKLLVNGMKILSPDSLMRSLKPLMTGYVKELTSKELGFEWKSHTDHFDGLGELLVSQQYLRSSFFLFFVHSYPSCS